jgi:SAM-dependent methyltransferase
LRTFHAVEDVPTNSCILLDTVDAAKRYPLGDVRLGFCDGCGFVFNGAFDLAKTEYSGRYEETQAFSDTFNRFHKTLAERLIEKHGLRDKDVLEIGCGKGEFLMLLAELGANRGVGIDPGVHPERIAGPAAGRLRFIADFYSEKYADLKVDFLACKMTLEHIPNPASFLATVRRSLGDRTQTVVFFQVPDATRILRQCALEDIYYEHCAYFSPGSLARLFRRAGFDVLDLAIEYGGQYLTIEARPRPIGAPSVPALVLEDDQEELRSLVATFPERSGSTLRRWRDRLDTARQAGETVVVWGSTSKAVAFLTTFAGAGNVAYVTDINPHRHNHFMAKTGHRIVPPSMLPDIRPDVVIVMNSLYETEVRKDLAQLGLSPEVRSL